MNLKLLLTKTQVYKTNSPTLEFTHGANLSRAVGADVTLCPNCHGISVYTKNSGCGVCQNLGEIPTSLERIKND